MVTNFVKSISRPFLKNCYPPPSHFQKRSLWQNKKCSNIYLIIVSTLRAFLCHHCFPTKGFHENCSCLCHTVRSNGKFCRCFVFYLQFHLILDSFNLNIMGEFNFLTKDLLFIIKGKMQPIQISRNETHGLESWKKCPNSQWQYSIIKSIAT